MTADDGEPRVDDSGAPLTGKRTPPRVRAASSKPSHRDALATMAIPIVPGGPPGGNGDATAMTSTVDATPAAPPPAARPAKRVDTLDTGATKSVGPDGAANGANGTRTTSKRNSINDTNGANGATKSPSRRPLRNSTTPITTNVPNVVPMPANGDDSGELHDILSRLPSVEPAPIPLAEPEPFGPAPDRADDLQPDVWQPANVPFIDDEPIIPLVMPPPADDTNPIVAPARGRGWRGLRGTAGARPAPRQINAAPRRRRRPRIRRVTRVVRHIDPWSVFKIALCFSIVLYGVCLTAGVLLWNVAYTTGTIDNIQRFFESFGWDTFKFKGGQIYHDAWIAGLFAALGLTGFAVLTVTLFNLITDLVGGIRVTVLEEEVIEREAAYTWSLRRGTPPANVQSRPHRDMTAPVSINSQAPPPPSFDGH